MLCNRPPNFLITGTFVRGCYHYTECKTSDLTPHWITNDFYCGAGIGGDTPSCNIGKTASAVCDAAIDNGAVVPIDGISGTNGGANAGAGLTDTNKGVYRKSIKIHFMKPHFFLCCQENRLFVREI